MAQNLVEKIAQTFSVGGAGTVHSGDYISISPAHILTHDNTGAVIPKFKSLGANAPAHPGQLVIALDHNVQDTSDKNIDKYKKIEKFAREAGAHFFPAGRGIGHQIMCEEGFAFPYTLVVASDSHANMYGGLGCLGTPVVRTDAAGIWATGKTWWQIPPVVKVELTGSLPDGVSGKDLILSLCYTFSHDEVLNHALEFSGSGCNTLSIEDRLTIANMSTEWGALAAVFPVDAKTIQWLTKQASGKLTSPERKERLSQQRIATLISDPILADDAAEYAKKITVDLSTVEPYIAGPNSVKVAHPASYFLQHEQKIDKAYLLSCVNARESDFAQAAATVKGRKIAPHVTLYMSAASAEIQSECEQLGYWDTLLDAGATPLPPGCGTCIGLGVGLLEAGETGISATNRNFKGRMGHPDALAFLASPAIVIESAIAGKISPASEQIHLPIKAECFTPPRISAQKPRTEIIPGFPPYLSGRVLFCPKDNINTDGIYPGKYTYLDDFTPAQQAEVVMENYDPAFISMVREGDFLASGFNFGTGSSREQAATALKYKGIKLVIAGSFNETYKRNALNNGFLVIDSPLFVQWLNKRFPSEALTLDTGLIAELDFHESMIWTEGLEFPFGCIGEAAQELIVSGGLEQWIKQNMVQEL